MIDSKILKVLNDIESDLNFKSLIEFMENTNILFIDNRIKKSYGMATYDSIYLNTNLILTRLNHNTLFFIILHEIAHYKRMQLMGKKQIIENFANKDFEMFSEHIIFEEMLADRYARLIYYKLNKEVYPKYATQCLDDPMIRERYKIELNKNLFGIIENKEEDYDNLMKSMIS
jgi:hypothetical protein